MSGQFKVHFSRYGAKSGQLRVSTPLWISADSFDDALRIANATVTGLKEGDPESEYQVQSVTNWGTMNGIECAGGRMFETAEEFSARVNANLKPE